jgi:hypothetical protein
MKFLSTYCSTAACIAVFTFPKAMGQHSPTVRSTLTTNSGGVYSLAIPNDPEEAWRQARFSAPQLADPAISGRNADPDKDGLPNIVERLIGFEPLVPNAGYPNFGLYPDGSFSMGIFRLHASSDLDPVFQVSRDLKRWKSGEEFTFVNPLHTVTYPGYDSWEETAKWKTTDVPSLYMRLAPVRPSRINFVNALTQLEAIPADLLDKCVVPSGDFEGAITYIPQVYPTHYVYHINWFFASVGLVPFVDSKPTVVKKYLERYLQVVGDLNNTRPENNYRMRDYNLNIDYTLHEGDPDIPPDIKADSDDSYAGTFLGLAARYALKYPGDSWFGMKAPTLKAIWTANIGSSLRPNGLVKALQQGYDVGLLEDNVEVWADTLLFADALEQVGDHAGAQVCRLFCNNLRDAIHAVLWDATNNAWKPADGYSTAGRGYYYAFLQCQYFPELYGFTHPSGYEETQRRYDAAWAWLEGGTQNDGMENPGPPWWTSQAWIPFINANNETDYNLYSDMGLAVVAMRRGKFEQARAFMALALDKWMTDYTRTPIPTNPLNYPGTIVSDIGHWHYLLKGAIVPP